MEKIGRHVAAKIKSIPEKHRTESEKKALEKYENPNGISEDQKKKMEEYSKKLIQEKPKKSMHT